MTNEPTSNDITVSTATTTTTSTSVTSDDSISKQIIT